MNKMKTMKERVVHILPVLSAVLIIILMLHQMTSIAYSFLEMERIDQIIKNHQSPTETSIVVNTASQTSPGEKNVPNKPLLSSAKNIFVGEKNHYELTAIFMDKAVINNIYVKKGDRIGNAIVEDIKVYSVVLNENGTRKTIHIFPDKDYSSPENDMKRSKDSKTKIVTGIRDNENSSNDYASGSVSSLNNTAKELSGTNISKKNHDDSGGKHNKNSNNSNNDTSKVYKEAKSGKLKEVKPDQNKLNKSSNAQKSSNSQKLNNSQNQKKSKKK